MYNPTICDWAFIFPHISSINLSLENPEEISNFSDNAYILNTYLCIPLGGHGAHRASSHREFWPKTAASNVSWETTTYGSSINGILASNKWSRIHAGASGSSTTSANVFVLIGISSIFKVGKRPSPSQVYWKGINPLLIKSVEMFIKIVWIGKRIHQLQKNPEPSALGFPCLTKVLPSQIRVSSGEKTLIPARTRMQTIINASRKRFLILWIYISDFSFQIELL